MEETLSRDRVRMNLSQSAKGMFQVDVTCEFGSVEESKTQLDASIKAIYQVAADNGLKIQPVVEK